MVAGRVAALLGTPVTVEPFLAAVAGCLQPEPRAPRVERAPPPVPRLDPAPRRRRRPRVPAPEPQRTEDEAGALESSEWDPEPPEALQEASRGRALLLELVRRAAHDWVLYRTSRRMDQLELAQEAYVWLFEEKPGHPDWVKRQTEGRALTAFLSICEALDLEPAFVREKVRKMSPLGIRMAGRPAENRYGRGSEIEHYVEHGVELVSLDDLEPAYEE